MSETLTEYLLYGGEAPKMSSSTSEDKMFSSFKSSFKTSFSLYESFIFSDSVELISSLVGSTEAML